MEAVHPYEGTVRTLTPGKRFAENSLGWHCLRGPLTGSGRTS